MGQLSIVQDRRSVGALAGQIYFYLQVPSNGRLKSVEAVNLTTDEKRIIISVCPKSDYPGAVLSYTQAPTSVAIESSYQGTVQEPVIWKGDLPMSSDICIVMACFRNVIASDNLKLACLLEVP